MPSRTDILEMIIDDCASDVKEFDGKPFTGKTLGELHGILEAKIEALAKIVLAQGEEITVLKNGADNE